MSSNDKIIGRPFSGRRILDTESMISRGSMDYFRRLKAVQMSGNMNFESSSRRATSDWLHPALVPFGKWGQVNDLRYGNNGTDWCYQWFDDLTSNREISKNWRNPPWSLKMGPLLEDHQTLNYHAVRKQDRKTFSTRGYVQVDCRLGRWKETVIRLGSRSWFHPGPRRSAEISNSANVASRKWFSHSLQVPFV